MPLTDGYSCKCKYPKCRKFHNNVASDGYCPTCRRIRRLFRGIGYKKLQGVGLPL